MVKNNINDGYSAEYTESFLGVANRLIAEFDAAVSQGKTADAVSLGLRAACILRIARFPYVSPSDDTGTKRQAFELQKRIYLRAVSMLDSPITEVSIPFVHRRQVEEGPSIPIYQRLPSGASADTPCPVILMLTGLDGYRTDNTVLTDLLISKGWAILLCEIPGTADCPADPKDASSPDRLWSSVLDWMETQGRFDMGKIVIWGVSAGGYYAVRSATTHSTRLRGAVAQGAGTHHFLSREWLSRIDGHEYPFE